jgi:hypothetical protein
MLQALAGEKGSRLVQISGPEGDQRADIAHEALVTQWPRLQEWLQTAAGDKRTFDGLIERATAWAEAEKYQNQLSNSKNKGKDQYLATGVDLQLFDDLVNRHRDWLSPSEIQYAETSTAARRREEARRNSLFRTITVASILFCHRRCYCRAFLSTR